MLGKKSSENKCNKRFLFSHEYRDLKMGGKNARNNFSRKHEYWVQKMLGKIVGKKCRKRFLYSHEYRDQKIGGKKRAKQFFQKHTSSASKKWEKIVGKSAKYVFYIHTNIVTKKWVIKRAKWFFKKTRILWAKTLGNKCRKKVRKNVFIFTRISWPKNRG